MHILTVDASKAQGRKLAKGQAVRIKQGKGFNLIVHPTTYKLATRAFNKGKAVQVKLSPEELEANKSFDENPTEMEGQEMQGEMVGTGMYSWLKGAYKDYVKPALKAVGKPLLKAGLSHLAGRAKEAVGDRPVLKGLIGEAEKYGTKKIGSGMRGRGFGGGMGGYGMGYGIEDLRNSARGYASANAQNAQYTSDGITSRRPIVPSWEHNPLAPRSRGMAIVGRGGSMLGCGMGDMEDYYPPALMSQPMSANYSMSNMLPVQYQRFNHSMADARGYGLYI